MQAVSFRNCPTKLEVQNTFQNIFLENVYIQEIKKDKRLRNAITVNSSDDNKRIIELIFVSCFRILKVYHG